ncbi:hypothetical protein ANANG_G00253290 [Anguilla anguilla]|uniref:Syndecan n=1 Tax=Anguilla anguilla TaxID=7936 RepID=A0A9D3LU44_ANGAN|nr:hypothetical protein ANANG_G00253290 [Anguilla anguilla]
MQKVWLLLFLFVAVYAESQVRETETWMPIKSQTDGPQDEPVSSGDFGFGDDDDDEDTEYDMSDDEDEDDDDEDDFSGSGDGDNEMINVVPTKPDVIDNDIPDKDKPPENAPPNVLMAHAGEEGVFSKPEVLAALIAGGAVGLLFAILLILLLIYRMKKKDEGSYDLGKKPIYTKAPTTEIYA